MEKYVGRDAHDSAWNTIKVALVACADVRSLCRTVMTEKRLQSELTMLTGVVSRVYPGAVPVFLSCASLPSYSSTFASDD